MSRLSQVVQMGEVNGNVHFYIEDYAYTYLKKQKGKEVPKYFLYGEQEKEGAIDKIFIYGILFNNNSISFTLRIHRKWTMRVTRQKTNLKDLTIKGNYTMMGHSKTLSSHCFIRHMQQMDL